MARPNTLVEIAPRTKLLGPTGFNNYDCCMNPYVGCEFGCTYCYVRFTVKHKDAAGNEDKKWGDFVKLRAHIADRLPKELDKGQVCLKSEKVRDAATGEEITEKTYISIPEARLVIGTMTDPYQPQETKARLTRATIKILLEHSCKFQKVGIFTRSPLVLQDLDLIRQLPNPRIHFTITPIPADILHKIEPISPRTGRRWDTVRKIKAAGIRLHLNISPILPTVSEEFIDEFAEEAARLAPAEYFVDPMQPYKESYMALQEAMIGDHRWGVIEEILTHKDTLYSEWKTQFRKAWEIAWGKYANTYRPDTLPIWSDHEFRVWVDLRTGKQMNKNRYGDDL